VHSTDHEHWHYLGFDRYELRRAADGSRRFATARPASYLDQDGSAGQPGLFTVKKGITPGNGDDYVCWHVVRARLGAADPPLTSLPERVSMLGGVPAPRRVLSVVGTRPNFMKTAPVIAELARRAAEFEQVLVHTGQHYDDTMSQIFLEELGVGEPDHYLDAGSGSHAQQTARVMERLEPVLLEEAPDVILVPGDVNSTLAAALVGAKLGVPVGHIEAGLRSFDRTMAEEINRLVADSVSELLFIHSPEARDNLLREGIAPEAIHDVGNTMIDTLVAMTGRIESLGAPAAHSLEPGSYLVVTLHRPALVDGPLLQEAFAQLDALAASMTVVFPAHPRTRKALDRLGLRPANDRLRLLDPVGYLEFLGLVAGAAGVLTDSGGIQEETTFLGVPCFTLRDNTERPITVQLGTNILLGLAPGRIAEVPDLIARVRARPHRVPPLWDGRAAGRIADVLAAAVTLRGWATGPAAVSPRVHS
jgi:UDP-N-acetylglucosamine 2-epimerase (non-hydrolysing)